MLNIKFGDTVLIKLHVGSKIYNSDKYVGWSTTIKNPNPTLSQITEFNQEDVVEILPKKPQIGEIYKGLRPEVEYRVIAIDSGYVFLIYGHKSPQPFIVNLETFYEEYKRVS